MNTTPDPLESVFTDYTDDTAAEVEDRGTDGLWRKARRRRIGRAATAGVAALALIAPATWLLANTAGADEPQPQAGEQERLPADTTLGEDDVQAWEVEVADADDFVGATVDLPSFAPGNTDVDEVCGVGETVVADGRYHGAGDAGAPGEGEAFILGTTFAALTAAERAMVAEGEPFPTGLSLVGFFGCDTGDTMLFQVVVLEDTGEGTWAAEQLVHSEPGGVSLKGIMAGDGMELLVGFVRRWAPPVELDDDQYFVERVLVDDGTVTRDPSDYDYRSLVIDMNSHLLSD